MPGRTMPATRQLQVAGCGRFCQPLWTDMMAGLLFGLTEVASLHLTIGRPTWASLIIGLLILTRSLHSVYSLGIKAWTSLLPSF